ncbi:hypothetical protein [Rivularia sp. UHCC 0363]|uniref:hypothetical protein n=1 Tax=Rivularia sp. UHCC 0363 TaxID=3110244 RepID=UPI002B1EED3B|nr:hypothetical protein [Rivularia sp. UHCC 0363]MEA5593582.1 hypothetical protein [Rivularia sp. UHCC 0363]
MKTKQPTVNKNEKLRAIAYSMDLLIPGIYIWCPWFTLKIGGSNPDDNPYRYPGMIHSSTGVAVVLPGYKIFTSYQDSYDA